MIKKVVQFIKKYLKELVLILCGLIVGVNLGRREKEQGLTEKMNKAIDEAGDISDREKQNFKEQLERINGIKDDKKRMEAKQTLWQSLNE